MSRPPERHGADGVPPAAGFAQPGGVSPAADPAQPGGPSPDRGRLGDRLKAARLGDRNVQLVFWLLVELWALNVADLLLTKYVLDLGFASESNAVMGYFLGEGTVTAAVFKVGIVTAGALLLWRLRRRPSALFAAVLLTVIFAAVVAYQLFWIASF